MMAQSIADFLNLIPAEPSRPPFLTGSRAYGIPRDDSDWDFVIHQPSGSLDVSIPGACVNHHNPYHYSVKHGPLNLMVFRDLTAFEKAKELTDELIRRKPVTRDEAVAVFQKSGLTDECS